MAPLSKALTRVSARVYAGVHLHQDARLQRSQVCSRFFLILMLLSQLMTPIPICNAASWQRAYRMMNTTHIVIAPAWMSEIYQRALEVRANSSSQSFFHFSSRSPETDVSYKTTLPRFPTGRPMLC